ncbi:minor tail protein [Microbacterium phage Megan]|uniref:Minor tail protein n=1 Tax=Microbacterium phage Megan TaxID=2656551 RepID=A0A649VKI3_9CAUD|nr:minor tail protein [Microbacterium phage Megan]QGJ92704.1 minor tail protein [Microbacterium phage Megan]
MSRPPVRTEEALLRGHERRIKILERRLAAAGYLPPHEVRYAGTTAERDAYFGVPVGLPAQVALANDKVTWFNTDWGWEESYYVAAGSAGLTAKGLITGTAAGWYPTGLGPNAQLVAGTTQSMTTGNWYVNWAAFGTGASRRRGGTTWWGVTTGSLVPKFAGIYRPFGMLLCQTGAGSGSLALLKNGSGAANDTLVIQPFTLSGTFNTPVVMPSSDLHLRANEGVGIYASSVGSATFGVGANNNSRAAGNVSLAYIGPALASD